MNKSDILWIPPGMMIPAGSWLDQFSVALRRSPPASPRTGRAGGAIADERIGRVVAHISARLDREFTIGELARVAGLSVSRLSLPFKA